MPFSPNSSSCPKKLSSEYQLYARGNFFGHSSILEKIAILGQPPRFLKTFFSKSKSWTLKLYLCVFVSWWQSLFFHYKKDGIKNEK